MDDTVSIDRNLPGVWSLVGVFV